MTTALLTVTPGLRPGMGFELERLRPANAPCALIEWPAPADDANVEGPIGPEAAAILTRALLRSGHVAFRRDDAGAVGRFFPEPAAPVVQRFVNALLDRGAPENFGVMTTADERTAFALFEWGGWGAAAQAAIAYDPAADVEPIVRALQHGLDWRRRKLPDGCRVLLGSGHDGDFALAVGASSDALGRFIADVEAGPAAFGG